MKLRSTTGNDFWPPMKPSKVPHLHVLGVFAILLTLVNEEIQARPRRFYMDKGKGNSLIRIFKSLYPAPNELFCPRSIEGYDVVIDKNRTEHGCGIEYNLCDDDFDCEPGLKCCPSGCIYKCVLPQRLKPAIAVDWIQEPEALTVGGNAWLIKGDGKGSSPKIDCSTSEFAGIEPMKCPSGFFCKIQDEGDESRQIPNRGVCMRIKTDDSFDPTKLMATDPLPSGSGCIMNGREVPHGHLEILDCKVCFCKDGEVFCRFFPCFNKKTL